MIACFGMTDYVNAEEWRTGSEWCERHDQELKELGIDFDIHGKDFFDVKYTIVCTDKELQMNSREFFMYEGKNNG